jgi:U3 small nucleolar RNA-associated protein 22
VTPLIVDFNESITSEDVAAINARLEAWRNIDPGMKRIVLLAATNHDKTGTAFTDGGPSKVVAARMTALARSACLTAKNQELDLDMEIIFRPNTDDYDFVIYISPKFTGTAEGKRRAHMTKFKNLEIRTEEELSLASFKPVLLFLAELQQLYTTSILFFHDPVSSMVIGGLWNPQTQSRVFKTNLAHGIKPISSSLGNSHPLQVEIDKLAILSEIARLGGDIIARIESRG